MKEAEDPLYFSYIVNCVFNGFSSYTAVMLNILTIHAMTKTSSLPKPLKTLLLSLAASDFGVGLLVQPFYIAMMVKLLQRNILSNSTNTAKNFITGIFVYTSFFGVVVVWCRQILGHSSSSQISGTYNSQTCCCSGDLNMGVQCISIIKNRLLPRQIIYFRSLRCCSRSFLYLYSYCLLQDLFHCATPYKSNSRPTSPASSTEWRNGKCREVEKICHQYILHIYCVFGLLFARVLQVSYDVFSVIQAPL